MEALLEVEAPVKFDQIRRNQAELVLALRSGRYTQVKARIKGDASNEFCFVGLGLELFGIQKLPGKAIEAFQKVASKLGLTYLPGCGGQLGELIRKNDAMGSSFLQLADLTIEKFNFPDVR